MNRMTTNINILNGTELHHPNVSFELFLSYQEQNKVYLD